MEEMEKIYWSSIVHDGWTLYAAATTAGLCFMTFPNQSLEDVTKWAKQHTPNATLEPGCDFMGPYLAELKEYLDGNRREFAIPLDLRGTSFQVSVWKTILKIPYGETATYSDIAESMGRPSAVRAVGAAVGRNPIAFIVPCHRVIGKGGALRGYRGGLNAKTKLLQLERDTNVVLT